MSQSRDITGALDARDMRIAVVAARFNEPIVASLLQGALASFERHGGKSDNLLIARVPGAFELPITCKKLAAAGRYAAVVALGCVIRGDTPHFDYVAGESARGLMRASLDTGVPVVFGVLTVENIEQALERAALTRSNKGGESMDVAIEMASLLARI